MTTLTAEPTITSANEAFMEAYRRKDAAAVADSYTEDAVILPPRRDAIAGRAAIESFWMEVMKMGITSVQLQTSESVEMNDTAWEVGRYVLKAGDAVADSGKYVVIWHFDRGAWKLHRDIWNSSVPA